MMRGMISKQLVLILLLANVAVTQTTPPAVKTPPKSTAAVELPDVQEPELDIQAVMKETEQVDMRRHRMGIFWWVPPDYWERALRQQGYSEEQARKVFSPFKSYNLFIVAMGDMGVGNISWREEADVKKSLVLRDQRGNTYKGLEETPAEMASIVDVMKPVFRNMMGNFGGGLQFIFFPLKDSAGNVFADPHKSSELFLDVADFMQTGTTTYTWRFPLTALSVPKYCSVGKEKVEASWKYCPWHGNKLENSSEPTAAASPAK